MPEKEMNILLTTGVDTAVGKEIRAVSPRIVLSDASELLVGEQKGDARSKVQLDAMLSKADIVCGLRLPENIIVRAPELKWIQMLSAGVDHALSTDIIESSVKITNASGIHATPIGEYVLTLILMFVKKMPLCLEQQHHKVWEEFTPGVLRSQVLGIIGLGKIGTEIARLGKAFGMKVIATRYSAGASSRARYVDKLLPSDNLGRLFTESDFIVCALPLTKATRNLIGKNEFRAMKKTAHIINIARGGIIDEAELISALENGLIAGAGLDVFKEEPLPSDSPLWAMPNVIVSPHIAGDMGDYVSTAMGIFIENLKCFLSHKRLLNQVNKARGY